MSDPQRPHGLQPTRLLHPWDFPGRSTGVGCHCLLGNTKTRCCKKGAPFFLSIKDTYSSVAGIRRKETKQRERIARWDRLTAKTRGRVFLKMRCIQAWDKGALGAVAITAAMATCPVSIPRSPEELPVSWIGWSGLWCQGVLSSTLVSPLGSRKSLGKLPYLSESICSLANIIIPSIQGWWEDPMR